MNRVTLSDWKNKQSSHMSKWLNKRILHNNCKVAGITWLCFNLLSLNFWYKWIVMCNKIIAFWFTINTNQFLSKLLLNTNSTNTQIKQRGIIFSIKSSQISINPLIMSSIFYLKKTFKQFLPLITSQLTTNFKSSFLFNLILII